jgi:3-hydroxybutyryl-CoA dehydrogenase
MSSSSSTIGVIGCGLMGSGIAEVFARAGHRVRVRMVDAGLLGRKSGRGFYDYARTT